VRYKRNAIVTQMGGVKMNTNNFEREIDIIVNQIKSEVLNRGKQINRNILHHLLKQKTLTDDEKESAIKHLKNYMQRIIEDSKHQDSVRISEMGDGRYTFYLTKTKTIRNTKSQERRDSQEKGIYLKFQSEVSKNINHNRKQLDIDLSEFKQKPIKKETIHFRIDQNMKRKLDDMCESEDIQLSKLLRGLLNKIL